MENEETTVATVVENTEEEKTNSHPVLKLVLGTAAALVAGWLVEKGIDTVSDRRNKKQPELTVVPDQETE